MISRASSHALSSNFLSPPLRSQRPIQAGLGVYPFTGKRHVVATLDSQHVLKAHGHTVAGNMSAVHAEMIILKNEIRGQRVMSLIKAISQ